MLLAPLCAAALLLPPGAEVGRASTFGQPGDRWAGGRMRCQRLMSPAAYRRALPYGVAHRRYPCGTELAIYDARTGRSSRGVVLDAGPWGAIHRGRWRIKRSEREPGRWRGVLDVLPPVARRLGLTGLDPVVLRVLP